MTCIAVRPAKDWTERHTPSGKADRLTAAGGAAADVRAIAYAMIRLIAREPRSVP